MSQGVICDQHWTMLPSACKLQQNMLLQTDWSTMSLIREDVRMMLSLVYINFNLYLLICNCYNIQ